MTVLKYFLEINNGEVRVYHHPKEEDHPNGHILFIGSEEEGNIFKGLLTVDGIKIYEFRRYNNLTEMVNDMTGSFRIIHPNARLSYTTSVFYASPHHMEDYVLSTY